MTVTDKKNGKAGAKVGHKGHRQQLMEPTEVIPVYPDECDCGGKEFENQQPFYTHQEIELPEIKMDVTHFILHEGDCIACGNKVKATVPQQHRTGFGPWLSALIGETSGIQSANWLAENYCQDVLPILFKV